MDGIRRLIRRKSENSLVSSLSNGNYTDEQDSEEVMYELTDQDGQQRIRELEDENAALQDELDEREAQGGLV